MHYLNQSGWATEDFDLVEFLGQDSDSISGGTSANGEYPAQNQFNDYNSEKDQMYGLLQYNDHLFGQDNNNQQQMYGHQLNDMSNTGLLPDNRYSSASNSLLNNTIEKLHNQQIQQQPSTSRLSNIVNNTPSYPNRMRPNMVNSMAQQSQLNSSDLAESVLLPTSSTSPQSNMYLTQPIVKCEPATYDMVGDEDYYNSTSDNESHYSSNGLALSQTGSTGKPRKYRIKPESERVNPQYRAKRAKNNDAVRRSREKAKHQQVEKERRLQFLEQEHNEHYKVVNQLNQQIRDLKAENLALRKNCNCGIQQVFRR